MAGARLRAAAELVALAALAVLFVGPQNLLPGAPAVGVATRDLFDHVALLDRWSVRVTEWGLPDGGALVPPDLQSMLLAAPWLGLGRGTAYNAAMVGGLLAAAVAGWALGRRMGNGLVGGVAFGLSPYLLDRARSGEGETVSAWPLAAMVLLLEIGGVPGYVGAGLAATVAALLSWYHGAFAGVVMVTWILLARPRSRDQWDRRVLLAPAVFAATVALPALLYARVLRAEDQLFRGPTMAAYLAEHPRALAGMVADPAAFLGHPTPGIPHVDGLGWLVCGLAAAGAVALWREDRRALLRWGGLLVVGLVLALGPVLHVRATSTGVPLPGRVLAALPFFGLMRLPHRWLVVAHLALAGLAARGARRLPGWVAVLLFVEAAWFLVPERPTVDVTPPAVHARIAGPVLDLPPRTLGDEDLRGHYLVWQRSHGQPIPYALLMQPLSPTVQQEPLVVAVAAFDRLDTAPERLVEAEQFRIGDYAKAVRRVRNVGTEAADTAEAAARLRALGIQCVVLHRDRLHPDDRARIVGLLKEALGPFEVAPDADLSAEFVAADLEPLLWRL